MPLHSLTSVVPSTTHLGAPAVLSHCCEINPSVPLGEREVVIGVRGMLWVCLGGEKKKGLWQASIWPPADCYQLLIISKSLCFHLFISSFCLFPKVERKPAELRGGKKTTTTKPKAKRFLLYCPSGLFIMFRVHNFWSCQGMSCDHLLPTVARTTSTVQWGDLQGSRDW